ncbi:MAG: hypothetical protein U0P82_18565 [Vicinamibacterales bacterium]
MNITTSVSAEKIWGKRPPSRMLSRLAVSRSSRYTASPVVNFS